MIARKILGILVPCFTLFFGLFLILQYKDAFTAMGQYGPYGYYGYIIFLVIVIILGVLIMSFSIPGILMFSISRKPRTGKMYYLNLSWVKYSLLFLLVMNIFIIPITSNMSQYGTQVGNILKDWHAYIHLIFGVAWIVLFIVARVLRKKHKLAAPIVGSIGAALWIIITPICFGFTNLGWAAYVMGMLALLCHIALQFVEFCCRIRIAEKRPAGQRDEPKPMPKPKPKPAYIPED